MTVRLNSADADFEAGFARLLDVSQNTAPQIANVVSEIIASVRAEGDAALCRLTEKFDRVALTPDQLPFGAGEIEKALDETPPEVVFALRFARDRIKAHHERQMPANLDYVDATGVRIGAIWRPIAAVGIYVPGGLASYPSSVLMNAVPAAVAGVGRIAMCVPTPDGVISPAVLAAAHIAGVTEIYRLGGAQAIAAMAYGTRTVAAVDKIVGPGNAFVAEAKRQVFGTVGIDMIAGPSEVLIIADQSANGSWIAADLLAQAEHGAGARSILVTTSSDLADRVVVELERQVALLPRAEIARSGWQEYGAVIVVGDLAEAMDLANAMAPEHLELAVDEPEALLNLVRNAGAVFLGHHTPEAVGDYVAGTNHVLPTAGTARFSSGLGTLDFLKRTAILGCSPAALAALGNATKTLAEAEGLHAHASSVSIRLNS
ncbi:MAG: histidinol dehydrogenase [Alphaproteobacteria bacterium]|nr:histidinol dehydrogenase [Alphaproteobacteria bacterium]